MLCSDLVKAALCLYQQCKEDLQVDREKSQILLHFLQLSRTGSSQVRVMLIWGHATDTPTPDKFL